MMRVNHSSSTASTTSGETLSRRAISNEIASTSSFCSFCDIAAAASEPNAKQRIAAFCRPESAAGSTRSIPLDGRVASAVLTGLQMIFGASASAIAAALFDGRSALAMTGTMAVCAVLAYGVYFLIVRPAERRFRAAHPHVNTEELEVYAEGVGN